MRSRLELRDVVSKATRRCNMSIELGASLLMTDTVARRVVPGQGPDLTCEIVLLFDTPGPRR
jgi:hypothetical protein